MIDFMAGMHYACGCAGGGSANRNPGALTRGLPAAAPPTEIAAFVLRSFGKHRKDEVFSAVPSDFGVYELYKLVRRATPEEVQAWLQQSSPSMNTPPMPV